jgi:uncharacterized protein
MPVPSTVATSFASLPPAAAWRHVDARDGFESVFLSHQPEGARITGRTCGVEYEQVWDVGYVIDVDARWRTIRAEVRSRTADGDARTLIESTGDGSWRMDGEPAPALDGSYDVDLESSACTNLLPVHRLELSVGESAESPAVYVRAPSLAVERLDQTYRRIDDDGSDQRYAYLAPRFGADFVLPYDAAGLVLDYPGLAVRVV